MANKKRFYCDCSAAAVWAAMYSWFFCRLPRLSVFVDEGTYLLYVQRFMQGYAPIVDDWGAEQFCAPFQYLPYKLYTTITGGSDGAILFMRYCYIAIGAVLFWYFYFKLRDRGFWGLLASAAFSAYIPCSIVTMNYYTMHVHALAVFIAIMFYNKKDPGAVKTVFAGIVFACAVTTEPPLAAIYFVYSLITLARMLLEKRGKRFLSSYHFIFNGKTWGCMTLGCAVCFILFLVWLQLTGGLAETLRALPRFLANLGYDYSGQDESAFELYYLNILAGTKSDLNHITGGAALAVFAALAAAAAVCRYKTKNVNASRFVFLAACICLTALFAVNIIRFLPFVGNPDNKPYWAYFKVIPTAPLLCFGLICHILRQNKNRKLFCAWALGALSTVAVDLSSEITSCVSFAAAIPAVVLMFPETAAELRETYYNELLTTHKKEKQKRTYTKRLENKKKIAASRQLEERLQSPLRVCLFAGAVILSAVTVFNTVMIGFFSFYGHENEVDNRLCEGVYRGLYVDSARAAAYPKMLADLRTIPEEAVLHVSTNYPELYLDAGCRISVCDPWYYSDESYDRQLEWWRLHPDLIPDYIYIPRFWYAAEDPDFSDEYFLNQTFEAYDRNFEYERTDGMGGILLKVTAVRLG